MTNILLAIIIVLLIARIVLQIWQGKQAVEKEYAAPCEVENKRVRMREVWQIDDDLEEYGKRGYELVAVVLTINNRFDLYFTRKKIKTYYE